MAAGLTRSNGTAGRRELVEAAIGAAAMLVLAAVLAASYGGGVRSLGEIGGDYRVSATFNRIDGLVEGAGVLVSGVPVGVVEVVALGPDYRARATLRLEAAVGLPVDTSAAIHTDGLFGLKFVSLSPGGADEVLADGGVIGFTQPALIVSELLELIIAEGRAARGEAPTGGE